ncbi:glutamine synthetase family protein [Streptacidiphilus sp. N1-10]|uniref:Glutamine synthetase family protein n=1 Tax=Streptacidiphilus jeojiensis TaxID=3229225 RepID=A0ABV6XFT4_9ACTN
MTDRQRSDRTLAEALAEGTVHEIEVAWADPYGRAQGKRVPAARYQGPAAGRGFAFCDGSLAWNAVGEVQEAALLGDPAGGYPDAYAVPDPATYRPLPWRPGAGQVIADIVDHHGEPARTSPRAVLRRVLDRLAGLGYTARAALELEFYLLRADGSPLQDGLHAYSLELANELDPLLGRFTGELTGFVPVEGVLTEYGPGQVELNLAHQEALTAADDAFRLRYAVKELARRQGLLATFMAKPFNGHSGSSAHIHLSLWRDGTPAFAPEEGRESKAARAAIGGLVRHLPGLTLFGAPTVNSYKRYEPGGFAPVRADWGGDDRRVAVRSLLETPAASRIELRTPAADANPYLALAAALGAVAVGLEDGLEPPDPRDPTAALPATLAEAVTAARADERLAEVLGRDAVHDHAVLAASEWQAYTSQVTGWETDRYLRHA